MKCHCILLLISITSSFCEWVLLPLVPKKSDIKKETSTLVQRKFNSFKLENTSNQNDKAYLEFHNLTIKSYNLRANETHKNPMRWEISIDDFNGLIKRNQQLPKTVKGKYEFVEQLEKKLAMETEKRIRNLFSSEFREARTKYIYYPSMESALMTISMLLFGVYLTKIILKLLQSHYNRYNTNIGMMGGIRTPIFINKGRKARYIDAELKKIHLIHLIDNYNTQFN